MIKRMAEKYNISLVDSWMVGDTTVDIMTGKNAGMKTALVLTGEAGQDRKFPVEADIVGETLREAVLTIFGRELEE
jgi:phosphoglycolate phosphatase-like HAD superfamily hydrolase